MRMFFISIDYNESLQDSYNGIEISENIKLIHKIFTGDFCVDWVLKDHYICDICGEDFFIVNHSSSIDHFFMDGDLYEQRPVKIDGEKYVFCEYEDEYLFVSVVPTGTQSFEEHLNYIKQKIKEYNEQTS